MLSQSAGGSFDSAYLLHEADFHAKAINAVESVRLPSAENDELKELLTDVLPALKDYLHHRANLAKQMYIPAAQMLPHRTF
jgi:putative membrane protein